MTTETQDGPITPFSDEQWARFYAAKDNEGEYMGWVYRDGRWVRPVSEGDKR
jgi:hypothetical protein